VLENEASLETRNRGATSAVRLLVAKGTEPRLSWLAALTVASGGATVATKAASAPIVG